MNHPEEISQKQINKIGKKFRDSIYDENDYNFLEDFKKSYDQLLIDKTSNVSEIISKKLNNFVLVGRLKRTNSIIRKLQRKNNYGMDLTRMSDIAGLRLIVNNMEDQNLVIDLINNKLSIEKMYDYRDSDQNYRSVHLILKIEEKLIEIQLETRKISNFDPLLWAKNNDYVPIVKIIKNYEGQEYNINGTPSITSKSSDNKSSTQKGGGSKKSTKIQRIIFKNNDIFSNYYVDIKNPLVIDGLKFASVEHYLNYEKYRNYGSGKRKKINNKIAELFVLDNGDNLSKKMLHNYRATNVYTTKIKKSSLLMKALMVKFSKTHNCQLLEKLKMTVTR